MFCRCFTWGFCVGMTGNNYPKKYPPRSLEISTYSYKSIYIYICINFITTSLRPSPGIMVNKGNHPHIAARFRLVNYYNLPRIYIYTLFPLRTGSQHPQDLPLDPPIPWRFPKDPPVPPVSSGLKGHHRPQPHAIFPSLRLDNYSRLVVGGAISVSLWDG